MAVMVASLHASPRLTGTVGGLWLVLTGMAITLVGSDIELGRIGRDDLRSLHGVTWVILVAIVSAAVVGSALLLRQPRHPVGWLFLTLAFTMLLSGAVDTYATYGALARPGSLPGARQAAVVGDGTFIPWLVLVALVLHLTPTGRFLGRRWYDIARATAGLGLVAFVSGLVADRTLSAPFTAIQNPMTVDAIAPVAAWVGGLSIIGVGLGLVASAVSLVVRFRRASGADRAQLLWLVIAVIPMPLFVGAAFAASMTNHDAATIIATGGFIVLVPVAAGLSVAKYHLYEVDRILSRTLTYTLLTVALVTVYASVVLLATRGLGSRAGSPAVSATLGAVSAAVIAAPLRTRLQDGIDRRFNRRRYDAIRQIRAANADGWADTDIEQLLRDVLADPSVRVRYWLAARSRWVTDGGQPSAPSEPGVEVRRSQQVIARVEYDPDRIDRETVALTANEAVVALDNIGLRAELVVQVYELAQSRSRIVSAQQDERRRIERDLHDGAQQRLLALALQLKAAQVNGDDTRLRAAVEAGIEQARQAVEELRELANGLHPVALTDGGLGSALDDIARRSPLPVHIVGDVGRLGPNVEAAAWFIACEAISNAQKHAKADSIRVTLSVADDILQMRIADDGQGGALADGSGLRGIRDRAEASGGTLAVLSPLTHGTTVLVMLPCA
jgi:signal transduction histidine kinase